MGKRYSDGSVKESPNYDGLNKVKDIGREVNHNIKIIMLLLLIPIIGLGSYFGYKTYQNNNNDKNNAVVPVVVDKTDSETVEEEYIGGYKVIGSLQIEKIGLDEKILNPEVEGVTYIDDALRYSIVKLYGEEMNEIGNFCMIAHDTSEFINLDELIVGDSITVSDESGEKMDYTVTEIMHVSPDNLTVLLPNEYETEITLITCEEGATTRLVVKAINN